MDSLVAVDKELDKALDSFGSFYDSMETDIDRSIDSIITNINDLINGENESRDSMIYATQLSKDQIKDLIRKYSEKHKDLHGTISKIGKVIEKVYRLSSPYPLNVNFISDFANLPQVDLIDTQEKKNLLNKVICEHFLRRGRIDVTDCLIREANLNTLEIKKESFIEMDHVLDSLRKRNIEPALEWCFKNRSHLASISSTLEFNLHRLNFIKLIEQGTKMQVEALKYARNFTPFAHTCKKEIQRLMTSLLYINSGLESSPYKNLLNADVWDDIEEEFIKNVCKLMGLPVEDPLSICINAGCKTLPALVNIVRVMQQTQVGHILSKDELPIEIDLGPTNHYHSVFSCPILRQQSTDLNPPMKLLCGHVISKDALNKLNTGGKLKCPYCPMEQAIADARQIFF